MRICNGSSAFYIHISLILLFSLFFQLLTLCSITNPPPIRLSTLLCPNDSLWGDRSKWFSNTINDALCGDDQIQNASEQQPVPQTTASNPKSSRPMPTCLRAGRQKDDHVHNNEQENVKVNTATTGLKEWGGRGSRFGKGLQGRRISRSAVQEFQEVKTAYPDSIESEGIDANQKF